ncbi:MAG TPA: hypothetical protein PLY34_13365 [Ferruginibacter sp.]|nr:hypothetical protein [Ferruginibacter sp.]HPH90127.1 hypothetical protein [Ferruginibacter sp.]
MKLQLYFVLFSVIFYSCSERKVYNQSEISDYERSKIELLNEYGLVSWDTLRYTYQLQEYSIKNSGIIPIEGKLSDLMMMTDSSFILKINSTLKQKTEYACLISLGYADFKVIKHYLENRDTKKEGFL